MIGKTIAFFVSIAVANVKNTVIYFSFLPPAFTFILEQISDLLL